MFSFPPKLTKLMDGHQMKMAFNVDRRERVIKTTQFSYTEPYEMVIFVSFKQWLNTSNFIQLKLINFSWFAQIID